MRTTSPSDVIWTPCDVCGIDWPFPKGGPDVGVLREWICGRCVNAKLAYVQRLLREYFAWGAMTGSDRDLWDDKFREAIEKLEA